MRLDTFVSQPDRLEELKTLTESVKACIMCFMLNDDRSTLIDTTCLFCDVLSINAMIEANI